MSLSTSFPSITGNSLNFNSKQFIADLANAAGNPNWNGIIKDEKIDLSNIGGPIIGGYNDLINGNLTDNTNTKYYEYVDYYKGIGDPRYPTHIALSAVFANFMPRIDAYKEVILNGGCKVINNYICNDDGVPMLQASENCQNNFNPETVTPQEIQTFIQNSYAIAYQNESDSFIKDLKDNYTKNGWTIGLFDLFFIKTFVLRLTKANNDNIYIKYFYDQKDYVSQQLNIPLVKINLGDEFLNPNENGANFIKVIGAGAPIYNQY